MPPKDDEGLALIATIARAGSGRSSLYRWLRTNHDSFAELLTENRVKEATVISTLGLLRNENRIPPKPAEGRPTWESPNPRSPGRLPPLATEDAALFLSRTQQWETAITVLLGDVDGRTVRCGEEKWEQRKVDAAERIAALGLKVRTPGTKRSSTEPDKEADAWIGFDPIHVKKADRHPC